MSRSAAIWQTDRLALFLHGDELPPDARHGTLSGDQFLFHRSFLLPAGRLPLQRAFDAGLRNERRQR